MEKKRKEKRKKKKKRKDIARLCLKKKKKRKGKRKKGEKREIKNILGSNPCSIRDWRVQRHCPCQQELRRNRR